MSEKTTIGGVVYETIGSSSSNLLLKCNGTARIQWGSKLIDLIKNGKIVSGNSELNIHKILDKSEIKSDGIYILEENDKYQLWLSKDDKLYNLTDSDLYISASAKLDITVELKKQALENIGLYFNTLKEVEESKIQEGLVYVLETKTLYTILGGVISEFEAKLKTITVEKEQQEGEIINNSIKIALAISDDEYITLQDDAVIVNRDLKINQQHCVCSEGASDDLGYRLYVSEGISYLDVDVVNIRQTISNKDYEEVTFNELRTKITSCTLLPGMWYAIMDFQNHWLFANLDADNRPILVQAYTNNSLYKEGKLLSNRSISLLYDYTILDEIKFKNDDGVDVTEIIKGKITWMRDENGNEADFDFLDYDLSFLEMLTTVVHPYKLGSSVKSVFPTGSYNNKITTYNLFGTIYNSEGIIQYPLNDEGVPQLTLNFKYDDSIPEDGTEPVLMPFHDNVIICKGITISDKCTEFCNNTFKVVENTTILGKMTDSVFGNVVDCYFNGDVDNVTFKDITNCWFMGTSLLNNVVCRSTINSPIYLLITSATYPTLYDSGKYKNVYYTLSWGLTVEDVTESGGFFRGLIIMFYPGIGGSIPDGWAICDGSTIEWEGRTITVPNLVGRFIKAVSKETEIGECNNYENNELKLEEKHLPKHNHPHTLHTHAISGITGSVGNASTTVQLQSTNYAYNISAKKTEVINSITGEGVSGDTTNVVNLVTYSTQGGSATGEHSHSVTITGGTISNETSVEEDKTWTNETIKLEPNYYALIFIIKL